MPAVILHPARALLAEHERPIPRGLCPRRTRARRRRGTAAAGLPVEGSWTAAAVAVEQPADGTVHADVAGEAPAQLVGDGARADRVPSAA
jgi:hypothetical protein